jgi:hypothetical protein
MKKKTKPAPRGSRARKTAAKPQAPKARATAPPASRLIDERIRDLAGWRGATLARMRALILEADPGITEEWKWGVPVWSHNGIVCTGEAYKAVVKLTFARGATVADPARLFNSSLTGNTRRAMDIREGEHVDAHAFKALVTAAVARNGVALLSGGNPQIAKADGDAPVQAYIAAMPGWKRGVGERLDALVTRSVPRVRKAVKWNSPFYGIEGRGWFLSFHVFTRYVKVTFFRGTALRPAPTGGKGKDARWIDVHEDDLDEKQLKAWVKQAAALPGWLTT